MASPLTQSIISGSGGDFTTLAAWEAQNLDLVTLDSSSLAIISGSWGNPVTTAFTFAGWTTNSSHTVTIMTTGSARHTGSWTSTAHRFVVANNSILNIDEDYIELNGLQVNTTSPGASGRRGFVLTANPTSGSNLLVLNNCIFVGHGSNTYFQDGLIRILQTNANAQISNCLFYNVATGSGNTGILLTGNVMALNNNTFIGGFYTIQQSNAIVTARNVYCGNASSSCYQGTITKTTCASSDATGTTGLQNIPYSTATFRNVTSGSEDFRLSNGSALIGVGNDLYNSGLVTWNTDIANVTRTSGSWDIGAFAYVPYYIPTTGFILNPYVKRFSSNIILMPG